MAAEQDIIIYKRMQLEDFSFMPFFGKVIEDYGFKDFRVFSEIRSRTICYGRGLDEHPTLDAIHQLIIKDCMVAFVIERRTEFNFIEATYVVCARGIRLARRRLRDFYKIVKERKKTTKHE